MKIMKFLDIEDILLSTEFLNKDLSYCDLSGIDLSELPASTWNDFIFDHTNFTDTNIRFYPSLLKKNVMIGFSFSKLEYCDFTNCDLSYLESCEFLNVSIKGSNFTNTNLDVEFTNAYSGNLDFYYLDAYPSHFKSYDDVIFPQDEKVLKNINNTNLLVNYQTLKDNPELYYSSYNIYFLIKIELDKIERKGIRGFDLNGYISKMLEEDTKREGKLAQFFNILNSDSPFTDEQRIKFFNGVVEYKKFKEIDLSFVPIQLLKEIEFIDCIFDKVIFPNNYEKEYGNFGFYKCFIPKVSFPTITPSSWDKFNEKRFGSSRITFHRNLYLELGRICNGKCKFCRNQYLEPCHYDFEKIKENLSLIRFDIDNIVIGGGEPTLLLDDIIELRDNITGNINWTIFTNGSLSLEKLIQLGNEFNLNISRHSVDDDVNNKILGVYSLTTQELRKLKITYYPNITLCATCFKGDGIDSISKMEDYIKLSDYCQIQRVLFQTLHKDLNDYGSIMPVIPIEDEIFDEMIIKLREQGYFIGNPIYSTGDYKLIIAKKDGKIISFKKYITKEELEKEWYQASKRTFDLSMDPSGNIYQNWHQSSGKVLLKQL